MSNWIHLAFTTINLFIIAYCVEFPKNKNILNSELLETKTSEAIENLDLIIKKIFTNKENSIVVFHADWCGHW